MLKLIPRDSFTIHSELSVEAIAARLSQGITTIPRFADAPLISIRWPWQKPKRPYEGQVTPMGFNASRIINYQNSFLPQIRGSFEPLPKGTAIHITIALHPWCIGSLIILGLFWYGLTSPLIFALLAGKANEITLLFLGMPLVFFGWAWLRFWAEAKRSRRDLLHMIGGQLEEEDDDDDGSRKNLGF